MIFGDQCKEVWKYIWEGPRKFDCTHVVVSNGICHCQFGRAN